MQLEKIVSGGQTGVDRAALDAARKHGVPIGGWCPRGRRAEDGPIPAKYDLRETPSDEYAQRTAWNVRDSDGTLIITDGGLAGGTKLTKEEAEARDKPWLHVQTTGSDSIPQIQGWAAKYDIRVLNVAGPRASEMDGIYDAARSLLDSFLEAVVETVGE